MNLEYSRAQLIIQYLNELRSRFGNLVIVETGTIRNTALEYVTGDGHSTHIIAQWLSADDTFYSIDLDTAVADSYLIKLELRDKVKLMQGNSLQLLQDIPAPIHLAYLDSANDARLTLQEFQAIESKIVKGGIVIVDDCVPGSNELLKGNEVIPYARSKGYRVELKPRQGIIRR